MILDHLLSKRFLFQTLNLLSMMILVINRRKEFLDDLLLLLLDIISHLHLLIFSLLLTITAELNQLVVVKAYHQEDRIQLFFDNVDPLVPRP